MAESKSGVVVVKEGWLEKQGAIVKNFQKRWFQLVSKPLPSFTYAKEVAHVRKQIKAVPITRGCPIVYGEKPHSFVIKISKRSWYFVAASDADRDEWIGAFFRCVCEPVSSGNPAVSGLSADQTLATDLETEIDALESALPPNRKNKSQNVPFLAQSALQVMNAKKRAQKDLHRLIGDAKALANHPVFWPAYIQYTQTRVDKLEKELAIVLVRCELHLIISQANSSAAAAIRLYGNGANTQKAADSWITAQAANLKVKSDVRFHEQPKEKDDPEYGPLIREDAHLFLNDFKVKTAEVNSVKDFAQSGSLMGLDSPFSPRPVGASVVLDANGVMEVSQVEGKAAEPVKLPAGRKPLTSTKEDDAEWEWIWSVPPKALTPLSIIPGRWTNIRVFISSTFIDMNGERDCLIKEVFPEVNNRLKDRFVRLIPVDLRWGVTVDEAASHIQTTCLNAVDGCREDPSSPQAPWFICLRGRRYGWVQNSYQQPKEFDQPQNLKWLYNLRRTARRVSLASMECYHALQMSSGDPATSDKPAHTPEAALAPRIFAMFRDDSFMTAVPAEHKWLFDFEYKTQAEAGAGGMTTGGDVSLKSKGYRVDEDASYHRSEMKQLDDLLKESTNPNVAAFNYPCKYLESSVSDEKSGSGAAGWVSELAQFRDFLTTKLYNSVIAYYPKVEQLDEVQLENAAHESLIEERSENFVGHAKLLERLLTFADSPDEKTEKSEQQKQLSVITSWLHKGFSCDGCGSNPLKGQYRYHCPVCNKGDYDLCQSCFNDGHDPAHNMIKFEGKPDPTARLTPEMPEEKDPNRNALVIYGEPGSGKSALLARACQMYKDKLWNERLAYLQGMFNKHDTTGKGTIDTKDMGPLLTRLNGGKPLSEEVVKQAVSTMTTAANANVIKVDAFKTWGMSTKAESAGIKLPQRALLISHLVGASKSSVNIRKVLYRICSILKASTPALAKFEIPTQYEKLVHVWMGTFARIVGEQGMRVVIVIDAVNQFDTQFAAHACGWLPRPLPPNVRLVLSTLIKENNVFANIKLAQPRATLVEMSVLSEAERAQIVSSVLLRYRKKLTTDDKDVALGNQMKLLLSKQGATNPLYLITACDALRQFGLYQLLTSYIKSLPETLADLFLHTINNLEHVHGENVTAMVLCLLAVSRAGLLEEEVVQILDSVDIGARSSNFARMFLSFRNFLAGSATGYIRFAHTRLQGIVQSYYKMVSHAPIGMAGSSALPGADKQQQQQQQPPQSPTAATAAAQAATAAAGGDVLAHFSATQLITATMVHDAVAKHYANMVRRHIAGEKQTSDYQHAFSEVVYHLVQCNTPTSLRSAKYDMLLNMNFLHYRSTLSTAHSLITDCEVYLEKQPNDLQIKDLRTICLKALMYIIEDPTRVSLQLACRLILLYSSRLAAQQKAAAAPAAPAPGAPPSLTRLHTADVGPVKEDEMGELLDMKKWTKEVAYETPVLMPFFRWSVTPSAKAEDALKQLDHTGLSNKSLGYALVEIAELYTSEAKGPLVETLFLKGIECLEAEFGKDSIELCEAMGELGEFYRLSTKTKQAVAIFKRCIAIQEKNPGHENEMAEIMNRLAFAITDPNDYPDAKAYFQRCYDIRMGLFGEEHADTATAMNGLGAMNIMTKNWTEALQLFLRALTVRRKVLGPLHPDNGPVLNNLSIVYRNLKQIKDAEMAAAAALTVQEEVLGKEHPNLTYCLNNLYRCQLITNPRMARSSAAKSAYYPEKVYGIYHGMAVFGYKALAQCCWDEICAAKPGDTRLDANMLIVEDLMLRCIQFCGGHKAEGANNAMCFLLDIYAMDRYWQIKTPLSELHTFLSLPAEKPASPTSTSSTSSTATTATKGREEKDDEEPLFEYPYVPTPGFAPLCTKNLTRAQQDETIEKYCVERIQAFEEKQHPEKLPDMYVRVAKLYYRQQKWADAQKYFELAIKHDIAADDNDPLLFVAYIVKICQATGNAQGVTEWSSKFADKETAEKFAKLAVVWGVE